MNHVDGNAIYMPHVAHFIGGRDCRFHLATFVNGWVVSTIGEYLPDAPVREIFAENRGVALEGKGDARLADYLRKVGYEPIGHNRTYETMVFPARPNDACPACPYVPSDFSEVDFRGYSDAGDAYRGHLELVALWATKDAAEVDA